MFLPFLLLSDFLYPADTFEFSNLLGLNVSLLNPHSGTAQSTDTLNKLVENPSTTTEQGSVTEDDNNT